MNEIDLDRKIKFWEKVMKKAFPFIKGLSLDVERNSVIFLDVLLNFYEFAESLNISLSENFILLDRLSPYDTNHLATAFDGEESKEKARNFQKNLDTFFSKIALEHFPEEYTPIKSISFFNFISYHENTGAKMAS